MWERPEARQVLREDGMYISASYIGHRQGTVAQWVDLYLIFKVCTQEQGFEGGRGGGEGGGYKRP